jgi:hypothetical protein
MKILYISIFALTAILAITLPATAGSYTSNVSEISNERGDGSPFAISQTENQSDDVRGYFSTSSDSMSSRMGYSSKDLSREDGGTHSHSASVIRSNAERLSDKDSSRDNGSPSM